MAGRRDGTAAGPAGTFERVLVTEEWTPLEPEVLEHKFYAPGVGQVAERQVGGRPGHERPDGVLRAGLTT